MGQVERPGWMDVSNTVDVTSPREVYAVVGKLMHRNYPDFDWSVLERLFTDFQRLYDGRYPGYRACDIRYHNSQHVLDVTLAMARLLDGHSRRHATGHVLDAELAVAGIVTALFHDSGYIRRTQEDQHRNGAVYTRIHVSRGARFLAEYLPQVGLDHLTAICTRIIHFTGYEQDPEDLVVASESERVLGFLLGTADLIAQMADIDYARKCREDLYEEFVAAGLASAGGEESCDGAIYRSADQLMRMTPAFIRNSIRVRLNGYFKGVHRYAAAHFGGRHLYMDAIEENCRSLEATLADSAG